MRTTRFTIYLWVALILVLTLAACGDDDVFEETIVTQPATSEGTLDPSAPGVTGTVPISGPADWLEWTPAEAPSPGAEAELVGALEELDMAMVIPTSPPPAGGPTSATFHSMSLGWGSGETFPDSTSISLNVAREGPNYVIVSVPGDGGCPEGDATVTFRGDPAACTGSLGDYSTVHWEEAGHTFQASFGEGLSLADGLVWLETWRLVP
jgi:hypothetical protein